MIKTTPEKAQKVSEITSYLRLQVALGRFDVWQKAASELPVLSSKLLKDAARNLYLNQPKGTQFDVEKQVNIIKAGYEIDLKAGMELLKLNNKKLKRFEDVITEQADSLIVGNTVIQKVMKEVIEAQKAFLEVPKRK